MRKCAISALAGLALLSASGVSRSDVTFGITLDVPLFASAPYYVPSPVYYRSAPAYYAPPVYYAPRASYYRPSQGHHGYYGQRNGRWDRDGDGIPNNRDRDRDGDGVRNSRDRQPNNPRRY